MPALLANRIGWFIRRLSRISPAEVPYRVGGALRTAAQGCGWFDVARPPAIADDATFGRPWVRVPQASFVDSQSVMEVRGKLGFTSTSATFVDGVDMDGQIDSLCNALTACAQLSANARAEWGEECKAIIRNRSNVDCMVEKFRSTIRDVLR